MADQFANGQEAERLGFGVHIPFLDLTETKLLRALEKIIREPTHAQNARSLGSAMVDQVITSDWKDQRNGRENFVLLENLKWYKNICQKISLKSY